MAPVTAVFSTRGIGKPLAIRGWRAQTYKFGAVLFAIEGDGVQEHGREEPRFTGT
jgi:hypothetical protein